MYRRPPGSTLTDTPFPSPTRFRSRRRSLPSVPVSAPFTSARSSAHACRLAFRSWASSPLLSTSSPARSSLPGRTRSSPARHRLGWSLPRADAQHAARAGPRELHRQRHAAANARLEMLAIARPVSAESTDADIAQARAGGDRIRGAQRLDKTNPALVARLEDIAAHQGIQSRSEEHTSELQSLMRISYAVFCLTTKKQINNNHTR